MINSIFSGRLVLVIFFIMPVTLQAQGLFQGLGDLPGGQFFSQNPRVSSEGDFIVLRSWAESGIVSAIWTPETGLNAFDVPDADHAIINGIAEDERVIVGHISSHTGVRAFVWQDGVYTEGMGGLDSQYDRTVAIAVSDDGTRAIGFGSVVVEGEGEVARHLLEWTLETGWQVLLQKADIAFTILGFSGDGTVIYGYEENLQESSFTPFRWTAETGQVAIDLPIEGNTAFFVQKVSTDGETLIGFQRAESFRTYAATWTMDGGIEWLSDIEGASSAHVWGGSGDGSLIVGYTTIGTMEGQTESIPTIWENGQPRSITDMLINDLGLGEELEGWRILNGFDISNDGTFLVGEGVNPDGNNEAWRADLSCLPVIGKRLPPECECTAPVFSWVPGQGTTFTNSGNWNPEGAPSESDIARFDVTGFLPVDFLAATKTDGLEIARGRVEFNLGEHRYTLFGEADCGPDLLVGGSSTELTLKGNQGALESLKEAVIAEGMVTVENTNLLANILRIGEQGTSTVIVDNGSIRASEAIHMANSAEAEATITMESTNDERFLILSPEVNIGVRGTASILLKDRIELVGPVLSVPEGQPLNMTLGVEAGSTGSFEIDGGNVITFRDDFDRLLRITAGNEGTGNLTLRNGGSMRIDDLSIAEGLGTGTVQLIEGGVLGLDSTLTMGSLEGSTATLTLSSEGEISAMSLGEFAFAGLGGTATINVQGNAELSNVLAEVDTTFFILGGVESAEGTITVQGSGAKFFSKEEVPMVVTVGARGRGDMQITDGGQVHIDELWIGRTETGFGSVFAGGNGAQLTANRLAVGPGAFGLLQVEEDALVTTDLLWVADNGQVVGDVIAVGTFEPSKRRATGIQAGGLLLSQNAQLDVESVEIGEGAVIGGTSTWDLPVVNTGRLMPGDFNNPAGIFTAGAGYEQTAEGALDIELGGYMPGAEHDQLVVTGTALLNGTLNVSLLSDFIPESGTSFTIVEASDVQGAFADVETPDGLTLDITYSSTTVVATVSGMVTVATGEEAVLPATTHLRPNYPNPFHQQTTIAFDLAEAASVDIVIYDMLGRAVRRVFEGQLTPGTHEVTLDAGDLPSGTYLCQMTTSTHAHQVAARDTKRMVLIR